MHTTHGFPWAWLPAPSGRRPGAAARASEPRLEQRSPKHARVLVLGTANAISCGRRDFAYVLSHSWGDGPGLLGWVWCHHKVPGDGQEGVGGSRAGDIRSESLTRHEGGVTSRGMGRL